MGKRLTSWAGSGSVAALIAGGGWVASLVAAIVLAVVVVGLGLLVYVVVRPGPEQPYARLRDLVAAWRGTGGGKPPP